ncbi:hypothetical protein MRX96_023568 [Rhipicephalus microplus]
MSTCARSVILISACAALAAAFAAEAQFELVPDTERVEQYDVLFRQLPSRRNEVGEPCRNSNHCRRGMCCLLARNRTRTCQLDVEDRREVHRWPSQGRRLPGPLSLPSRYLLPEA